MTFRSILLRTAFGVLAIGASGICALGQMTVINNPSTDTLPRGTFYIEADLTVKPKSYADGGFQSYGYRTVYGLDGKTDVGVSLFYTREGSANTTEAQLSIKRAVYSNERSGFASAAGVTAFVPLKRRPGEQAVIIGYANAAKTFKGLNGLRVTGGVYHVLSGPRNFGRRSGVTIAFEQPVMKRVSLMGDWLSGRNRLGYAAAGVTYVFTKRQSIAAAYNFSNSGHGDNFLYIYYMLYLGT